MISLEYDDLPDYIVSDLSEKDFLLACLDEDSDCIATWVINHDLNMQKELVFLRLENRYIPVEERVERLPQPHNIKIEGIDAKVVRKFEIEPETDILNEILEVSPVGSNGEVLVASQAYFSTYKHTLEELANQALRDYELPKNYLKWSEEEKIHYWVGALYRFRRHAGEDGLNEDSVFDDGLVDYMKKLDPDISKIMHSCISKLAEIEQIDAHGLVNSFEFRTGIKIS